MSKAPATIRGGQAWHGMLADPNHDDTARQFFVRSLMREIDESLGPGNTEVWEKRVRPRFEREHGRDARHIGEIRRALMDEPFTQYWSSIKRCSREMMTEATGPMVERQLPELIARARAYRDSNRKIGSLELDPSLEIPRYMTMIHHHAKPGNYHSELTQDDVFSGAEYDHSFFMAARPSLLDVNKLDGATARKHRAGGYGPLMDDMGACLAAWMKKEVPELKPRRILDLGCTVGHSTLPWVDAFPDAEVHAIDTAAPVLRYGHARAEALGKRVHFSQQNAEATRFADASFDIVASHLLLHELTVTGLRKVFVECHRLLKPGGTMLHLDVPPAKHMDMMAHRWPLDWNTHFNAEPFITTLTELDLPEVAAKAGFAREDARHAYAPSTVPGSASTRHFFVARK